jgi:hypothetical protein
MQNKLKIISESGDLALYTERIVALTRDITLHSDPESISDDLELERAVRKEMADFINKRGFWEKGR